LIPFLWRKIWKNKWLMLCLIIGNIILVAIVTVVPLFIIATQQRLFLQDFRIIQESKSIFPAIMQLRYNFNAISREDRFEAFVETRDVLVPEAIADMGVPVLFGIQTYTVGSLEMLPVIARDVSTRSLHLVAPEGLGQHVRIVHGRMPSVDLVPVDRQTYEDELSGADGYFIAGEFVGGYIVEALAVDGTMYNQNLLLNELMVAQDVQCPDGGMLHIRIVGIFELAEGSDAYWSVAPATLRTSLFISDELVSAQFVNNQIPISRLSATWTHALDWQALRYSQVPHYVQAANNSSDFFNDSGRVWDYSVNFDEAVEVADGNTDQLNIIVWVLQIPIFVMLALFMYMVAKQILNLDSNDISVIKSRGASRRQILGIYALQGLFIGAASFPAGLGLGVLLCQVIGSSGGFLELAGRAPLDVVITSQAVLYGAIGVAVSWLYLLLPVVKLSKVAIVESKRRKSRKPGKPIWERFFLDVLALAMSIYLLYNFNMQREHIMASLPESRTFDPLLFFGSSLFIIGAALLLLRLYPYLMKLVFMIGRGKFGPAIYASVVKVSRSGGGEQFIMLFLVFTVAVGIFSAQSARTMDLNNADQIRYLGGADLMIREAWSDNLFTPEEVALGAIQPEYLIYTEPDFNRFLNFEEVDAVTRVTRQNATLRIDRYKVDDITLMGIETKSFGETAWFRDDLTMIHVNYFLNILGQTPEGVLLSSTFHELGYNVGDIVSITAPQPHGPELTGEFEIVGFIDFWPTFSPVKIMQLPTGELAHENQYLAVANLGQLQSIIGVRPYQIWMKTNSASHQFIHDFIEKNDIMVAEFYDTSRSLSDILLDPTVQSTNGILTIGFIMTMLLCFAGFLIYWVLSIRERLLQFGVFRAMGLGMRGIIGVLICEQALITISALLIGGAVGLLASELFVPLLQLSYTAAHQVIPMLVVMAPKDFVMIYSILGFVLVLCVLVLVRYTLRINITQVLKLGED